MGMLTRVRNVFSRPNAEDMRFQLMLRGAAGYGPDQDYWFYPVIKDTAAGVKIDEYNALESGDVYKCVRVIAETIASLPLFFYKRQEHGKKKAEEHPLFWLLHYRPNSEMTKFSYWETVMGHILTWGNHYSQISRDGVGDITDLWPLRPDRMEIKRGTGSDLLVYEYRNTDGTTQRFTRDEIFHVPGLGFNGITGYSPIAMAREAIALGMAAQEFSSRFFSNDQSPGGVFRHPNKLSQAAYDRLKESLKKRHGGLANKWNPAILEEGMEWQTVGINMRDAQFLEIRKFQRNEICGIFRVPPHMVGDLERATFSNIEQQSIDFVVNTIRPWLVRLEQAIWFQLLTEKEQKKYFAEHLIDGLLRGDIQSRYAAYAVGRNWGWLSANDVRALENMNPIDDGGDIYLVPMNMSDMARLEEKEEIRPQIGLLRPEEIEEKPEKGEEEGEKEEKTEEKEEKSLNIENEGFPGFSKEFIDDFQRGIVNQVVIELKPLLEKSQISANVETPQLSEITPQPERYKDPPKPEARIEPEKLNHGFRRIWEDGVARVVRRESIAIHRALKRQDINGFESHMEGFYTELPKFMSDTLHPSIQSYADVVDSTGTLNCLMAYIDSHIRESRDEVSKWSGLYLFTATSDNSIRANERAIDDCLDVWTERRPEQAAEFFGKFFATS